jgi:uncharacterized membrane protein YqiK
MEGWIILGVVAVLAVLVTVIWWWALSRWLLPDDE